LTAYGHLQDHAFCEAIINYFEIEIEIIGLENIPETGGAILALNHPLGGMDGVALIHALRDKRPDVALIVNDLLLNIKQLSHLFVGINKFGRNDGGVRQNIRSAFEKEQAVIIFPAGMVTRIHYGQIVEAEWKKTFISYARQLQRPIIPIYIDGRLSDAFYRINRWRKRIGIKANIEMFLLADEMYKQKKGKITFVIGAALTPQPSTDSKQLDILLLDPGAKLPERDPPFALAFDFPFAFPFYVGARLCSNWQSSERARARIPKTETYPGGGALGRLCDHC
jgi:hypothetical protein